MQLSMFADTRHARTGYGDRLERVVVIEDEIVDFLYLTKLLKQQLPFVEVIHFSRQAELERQNFDLAACPTLFIVDYYTGQELGERFVHAIRRRGDTVACAPVIMLTGATALEVASRSISGGVDEILYKQGLSAETLQLALLKSVKNWRSRLVIQADAEHQQSEARMLAHDLRNPISSIHSACDLILMENRLTAGDRHMLHLVQNAAEQALHVITERLSILVQSPARGMDGASGACLNALLEDLQLLYALKLHDVGGILSVGPVVPVSAPPGVLKEILMNLIDNSIKFRSDRPLHIQISAREQGDNVIVEVIDNGQGFRKSDTLIQLSATSGQSGNGLRHLERLLHSIGGKMRIESDGVHGTEFRLYFPVF